MALIQVVYVSAASGPVGREVLASILKASSRNNARDGLTGMLVYTNGMYMQVLEGEEQCVDRTLRRIGQDPRHSGLVVIDRREIDRRSFGRWHMGYRRAPSQGAEDDSHFVPLLPQGFDLARVAAEPGVVLSLLESFARS